MMYNSVQRSLLETLKEMFQIGKKLIACEVAVFDFTAEIVWIIVTPEPL